MVIVCGELSKSRATLTIVPFTPPEPETAESSVSFFLKCPDPPVYVFVYQIVVPLESDCGLAAICDCVGCMSCQPI